MHTVPSLYIGNRIAVAFHNFRIEFFVVQNPVPHLKNNRVMIPVCLFSPRFSLGSNIKITNGAA